MSKIVRGDNLKIKKQDSKVLRTDESVKKKLVVKKPTSSTATLKTTAPVKDNSKLATDDKVKRTPKLAGTTGNSTLSKTKTDLNKPQTLRRPSAQPLAKTLTPRKVNSISQPKNQPLRAKHFTTTQNSASPRSVNTKVEAKSVYKKPNKVLDTPLNVTVSSPPPQRKNEENVSNPEKKWAAIPSDKSLNVAVSLPPSQRKNEEIVTNPGKKKEATPSDKSTRLNRKGSRTLAPDEIVVLKRDSAKLRIEEKIRREGSQIEPNLVTSVVKEPIAFEVNFEDKGKRERSSSRAKIKETNAKPDKNEEDNQYSDDFDSYESDFETGSSAPSQTSSNPSSHSSEEETGDEEDEEDTPEDSNSDTDERDSLTHLTEDESEENEQEDEEEDSEVTQNPITVIQRDKERKLDSGHYEMNSAKNSNSPKSLADFSLQSSQAINDSLEPFSLGLTDQMDSGIATYNNSVPSTYNKSNMEVVYGGYRDFNVKPIINQRGSDLMSKIQFDVLSFTLLELKPISYDIYMQTFGKLNTNQKITQTQDNRMDVEQQTEVWETRSVWTQHPAQYDLEIVKNLDKNGIYSQNCCGELKDDSRQQISSECDLERSLDSLKNLNTESSQRSQQNYQKRLRKPINYELLNSFLLRSSAVIQQILGSTATNKDNLTLNNSVYKNDQVLSRLSEYYFHLESNFLNTLQVVKIFANNKYNLVITVHESLPDTKVYSSDFTNLLMVWCTNQRDKPSRLLTTWSEVSRVEISNDSSDIIVAALRDGSIALWDLRETYSFCSKLDGYLTHFAATQSLVPAFGNKDKLNKFTLDLGACLDVRSFRSPSNNLLQQMSFPKTQFVSLHDSGIVTIWSLLETSEISLNVSHLNNHEKSSKHFSSSKLKASFEYTSPWARVKLTQSNIANVKDCLETKTSNKQTRFDKTKTLFQNNIYSDEALKELNESSPDPGNLGLRFTSLECGSDNIFLCTNRNYILMCSKTLKMDQIKKIVINESRFLFPTALKMLSNENFLAVGLSNGAVMILNCQGNKTVPQKPSLMSREPNTPPINNPALDFDSLTGKSCAIQNIVLNSKKSYEDMTFEPEYRPTTAAIISLIESQQKPFELRIFDQQIIMNGSALRKNLIKSLELSSDGWRLFALANGHVRAYDFCLDHEIPYQESLDAGKIMDIATGKYGGQEKCLMLLKPNTQVEVLILNK